MINIQQEDEKAIVCNCCTAPILEGDLRYVWNKSVKGELDPVYETSDFSNEFYCRSCYVGFTQYVTSFYNPEDFTAV